MARKSTTGDAPKRAERSAAASWIDLTWDDLDGWAGGRTVERGRSYQRGGRVRDLAAAEDGALLATVDGTHRYVTTATLGGPRARPLLESACSCPVGSRCKHAVAVVAAYLDAVASGRPVPIADPEDPRWDHLDADPWDEIEDDVEEEDAEPFEADRLRPSKAAGRRKAGEPDWDARIERHLRSKPQAELADLAWGLARRFPEVYQEFRERLALQEGDADRLVAEARREIRRVTSEDAWRDHWSDGGHTPDYGPIRRRLERLLELGHADAVVTLGRLLIEEGLQQVAQAHDEGETYTAFAGCLPVVFEAVARSGLPGPARLMFAIDAMLADDYDAIGDACGPVLDASHPPEDWSAVADALAVRLERKEADRRGDREADRPPRDYERDRIARWAATALEHAGREEELEALHESEARASMSYERLVGFLLERRRFDDAERRAREGIAATVDRYPGIASQLAATLRELARSRKRWDVVAAHVAQDFFDRPTPSGFDELIEAARKARVEAPVREAALRFLETGTMPYRVASPPPAAAPAAGRSRAKAKAKSPALERAEAARSAGPAPGMPRVEVDASWPLPVPEELVPMIARKRSYDPGPRPHLEVLLRMAIAAGKPDEVLRWHDRMAAESKREGPRGFGHPGADADTVAEAVADAYPERAIAIYRAAIDAQLPHAQLSAYQAVAGYLRRLRPLFERVGRPGEWDELVAAIRGRHRNRPRFMEQLDRLDRRPIVRQDRPRRG